MGVVPRSSKSARPATARARPAVARSGATVPESPAALPARNALRKGERTRLQILDRAAALASTEGLSHLTIGSLAEAATLSKSGLFSHFGSKEELQLATVEHALGVFRHEVLIPAEAAPAGIARLWALAEGWLDYCAREVFPGGCFFAATSAEFNNRDGSVHELIAKTMRDWIDYLAREGREAQRLGQLPENEDPAQLAFELYSLVMGANWSFQLAGDPAVFDRARRAMGKRLDVAAP
jgi:AcrR family transcriptional regulator